jgi:hypothetical protein
LCSGSTMAALYAGSRLKPGCGIISRIRYHEGVGFSRPAFATASRRWGGGSPILRRRAPIKNSKRQSSSDDPWRARRPWRLGGLAVLCGRD